MRFFFKNIFLLFFILFSAYAYSLPLRKVSVELKWFHQFQFAGIYAAKEKGFYQDEGLDVQIIERDPKSSPVKDVLDGKADFGISDGTLIHEKLIGKNLVLLAAIYQHSPLVLITLEKNHLISPLELKGKKVMYQKDVDDAILNAMFSEFGITPKDFIFIPHTFKDDALLSGEADAMSAYIGDQPYWYLQKGVKINIIKPSNYGIDFYGDLLFTSENFFLKNREVALAFRRATLRGWEYALERPDEVISWIIGKYHSKKSPDALRFEYQEIKKMIAIDQIELGTINPNRLKKMAEIYEQTNPQSIKSSLYPFVYSDYFYSEADYKKLVFRIFLVIFALILLIFVLFIFNKKLKSVIQKKTNEISNTNKKLNDYLDMLGHYAMVIRVNNRGVILDVSNAFNFITENAKQVFMGRTIFGGIRDIELSASQKEELRAAIKNQTQWSGECRIRDSHFGYHYFNAKLVQLGNQAEKDDVEFLMIFDDITEKKNIEAVSMIDSLTLIYNRHALVKKLNTEWYFAKQNNTPLSLIMVDLDFFKNVNDRFGHDAGDHVLQKVAKILQDNVPDSVYVGRWGGEEFLLICSKTTAQEAALLAEKLRQLIGDAPMDLPDFRMTASFGVSQFSIQENTSELVSRADRALYVAKRKRNCVEIDQ